MSSVSSQETNAGDIKDTVEAFQHEEDNSDVEVFEFIGSPDGSPDNVEKKRRFKNVSSEKLTKEKENNLGEGIYSYTDDVITVQLDRIGSKTPLRATRGAACYDLFSCQDVTLLAGKREMVNTGVKMDFPSHLMGKIFSRSGLAMNRGIDVVAGVIDSDFRGEIEVCLHNTSNEDVKLREGERIAQMAFIPVSHPEIVEILNLAPSERGKGGFGHTGD